MHYPYCENVAHTSFMEFILFVEFHHPTTISNVSPRQPKKSPRTHTIDAHKNVNYPRENLFKERHGISYCVCRYVCISSVMNKS